MLSATDFLDYVVLFEPILRRNSDQNTAYAVTKDWNTYKRAHASIYERTAFVRIEEIVR